MPVKQEIVSKLRPQYFWDVDRSLLDDNKSARLIIERVFSLGDMHEINQVIGYYGEAKILSILTSLNFIDAKTFNFIVKLFKVPPTKFKCYENLQLKPRLWS
jgi:hypothetical protein